MGHIGRVPKYYKNKLRNKKFKSIKKIGGTNNLNQVSLYPITIFLRVCSEGLCDRYLIMYEVVFRNFDSKIVWYRLLVHFLSSLNSKKQTVYCTQMNPLTGAVVTPGSHHVRETHICCQFWCPTAILGKSKFFFLSFTIYRRKIDVSLGTVNAAQGHRNDVVL